MGTRPTVISIFAGCGGSSLGYKIAGFDELLAIDFDRNSVGVFGANFPNVPVWKRDIKTVVAEEILSFCKIKIGELCVLDGSPPCQGFSTSGKRDVNDTRNSLFREFFRLVDGIRPMVFVMENVSGMVKGKMKGIFKEVMVAAKEVGYDVKCKMMNSKYYGVPQSRERLIWIGVRTDIGKPSFPIPNKRYITVKQALRDIKDNDLSGTDIVNKKLLEKILLLRPGKSASHLFGGKYFNTRRLDWHKPSPTITKMRGLIHPQENRYLSTAELKRLTTFPDNFIFLGTPTERWARMGNAVMPRFMEAIARHIKVNILGIMDDIV